MSRSLDRKGAREGKMALYVSRLDSIFHPSGRSVNRKLRRCLVFRERKDADQGGLVGSLENVSNIARNESSIVSANPCIVRRGLLCEFPVSTSYIWTILPRDPSRVIFVMRSSEGRMSILSRTRIMCLRAFIDQKQAQTFSTQS